MPVKSKTLFDHIGKEYNLGSYEEFQQKLQDPAKRKALYDAVGQKYNLGTFDEFEHKLGFGIKKKDGGGTSSQESHSPSASPSQSPPYKGSIFDNYMDEADPVKSAIAPHQKEYQDILQRNISADNTYVKKKPIVLHNDDGKTFIQPDGERELQEKKDKINEIKAAAFPNTATAKQFLNKRFSAKGVEMRPKAVPHNPNAMEIPDQPQKVDPSNLDHFDINDIEANIDPSNLTEKMAFNMYQKKRNMDDVLSGVGSFEDKAIKYYATQDKTFKKQLDKLTLTDHPANDIPNVYAGELVANFLNNPDVRERAQHDPKLAEEWKNTYDHLYDNYPEYAKKNVAQIISQERERRKMNNWFANVPSQKGTDELVDELIKEKKLQPRDKAIYEKMIRPYLGVWNSIGRGVGKLIPGVNAAINDSPIATPGLLETTEDTALQNIHGMANTVEDLVLPGVDINVQSDQGRLYDKIKNDHQIVSVDPIGFTHNIFKSTGQMAGLVIPMVMGGEAFKVMGADALAAETLTNVTMFAGNNYREAQALFPDDEKMQNVYTILGTGIDAGLAKLLPTKEAREAIQNEFKPLTQKIVENLASGKITEADARKTLLDKIAKIGIGSVESGSVMAAFGIFHSTLDNLTGGRDVKSEDVINQAFDNFKMGSLGSGFIHLAAANAKGGEMARLFVPLMANDPERFRKLIEDQSKLNPSIERNKVEYLQNLEDAVKIANDLKEAKHMTPEQKNDFLLHALVQKINERKADATHDDVIKKDYEQKAKDAKKQKESIYKGEPTEKPFYEDEKNIPGVVEKIKSGEKLSDEEQQLRKNFSDRVEAELRKSKSASDQQNDLRKKADDLTKQAEELPPSELEKKRALWDEADKLRKQADEMKGKEEEPISDEQKKQALDEKIPKEHQGKMVKVDSIDQELRAEVADKVLRNRNKKLEEIINDCLTKHQA